MIRINEPTDHGIVVSALQIIQSCFGIVVITPIAERVDFCNSNARIVLGNGTFAPSVITVFRNNGSRFVCDRNDVTLQILIEIVCSPVVFQTTNRSVKIIQILVYIAVAVATGIFNNFFQDICPVKDVFMDLAVLGFLDPDSVVVVAIGNLVKCFELSAFFPCQRMSKISGRVAVGFIISYNPFFVNEKLRTRFRVRRKKR